MKGLLRLRIANPNTINESITAALLKIIVSHDLFVLLRKTSRSDKKENKIDIITSVQNPTTEISVRRSIDR